MIRTTTGRDLCELFDAEARRHLEHDMEVPSLPTAQGSIIMYMNSAYFGRDRAGAMYRHLGYDMLERLEIPSNFEATSDLQTKRAHSTAVWGAYCYERQGSNPFRVVDSWANLKQHHCSVTEQGTVSADSYGSPNVPGTRALT